MGIYVLQLSNTGTALKRVVTSMILTSLAQNANGMRINFHVNVIDKSIFNVNNLKIMLATALRCSRNLSFSIPTLKDRSLLAFTAFQGYWMHFFLAVSMSCTVLTEEVVVVVAMLASQLAFRANKAFVNNEQQSWRRLR